MTHFFIGGLMGDDQCFVGILYFLQNKFPEVCIVGNIRHGTIMLYVISESEDDITFYHEIRQAFQAYKQDING